MINETPNSDQENQEGQATPTNAAQPDLDGSKAKVNKEGKEFFQVLIEFTKNLLTLRPGTDYAGTREGIRNGSNFTGANAWILICSIIIASVGLNVNSTAVVIGAMLISPLMGPILGVGLGVGSHDFKLIWVSLRSLGIAVGISLLVSFLYFKLTPFKEPSAELLGRTQPHFLDVIVAVVGGLAGIIAGSRSEKTNVIPGVAIATALMPPLCTAGYGLAIGNYSYFGGAFYLFMLNSVLIATVTVIVVRYLRFPILHYVNKQKERWAKWAITVTTVLLIVPSGYLFYKVVKVEHFESRARHFVKQELQFENTFFGDPVINYTDTVSTITVLMSYGEPLSHREIAKLNDKLVNYDLEDTKLKIVQKEDQGSSEADKLLALEMRLSTAQNMQQLVDQQQELIGKQEDKIGLLEKDVKILEATVSDTIAIHALHREAKVLFPKIKGFSIGYNHWKDEDKAKKKLLVCVIEWEEGMRSSDKKKAEEKLQEWIEARFKESELEIFHR